MTLHAFGRLARHRHFAPYLFTRHAAMKARLQLEQGYLPAAVAWAETSGLSTGDAEYSYPLEREHLTLARVRIAQGRIEPSGAYLNDALRLLNRLLPIAEAHERQNSILEILILQALALDARGDRKGALTRLERALRLGESQGYMRVFLDEALPMTVLLRQAHPRTGAPQYVANLLLALGEQAVTTIPFSTNAPDSLVEPLTEREREVMRLLLEGLSNREIAQRLVVSVNTAKKHVHNICSKLGAQSRTQALAKARMYHLV